MKLTSPEFGDKRRMPKRFTCEGEDINPPLVIEDIPAEIVIEDIHLETKSLVLIVDDPDVPWVHWVVYDIPVVSRIDEDSIPGKQGLNDFGERDYRGPCPPAGTHQYFFKVYALDTEELAFGGGRVDKKAVEKAMHGCILAKAELIGLYTRGR